jgi:hypothetical protein
MKINATKILFCILPIIAATHLTHGMETIQQLIIDDAGSEAACKTDLLNQLSEAASKVDSQALLDDVQPGITLRTKRYLLVPPEKVHCLIIPGQNGMGGDNVRDLAIMPEGTQFHDVATPKWFPDLGQSRCQKYLADVLKPLQKSENWNTKIVIHATSQATATTINYISKNPDDVKFLILESILASGNSAIHHTANNLIAPRISPYLVDVRGSYYFYPYIAKCLHPLYWPAGEQAIESVKNISNNMTIIILHSAYDPQLSVDDAQALYYKLRTQGNDNTYFIRKNGSIHLYLLGYGSFRQTENRLHAAFIKDLIAGKEIDPELKKPYQPDPALYKASYDTLIAREEKIRAINAGLYAGAALAVGIAGGKYLLQ